MQLNDFGKIVDEELKKSQIIRDEIILDQYVIMPNHIHGVIVIAAEKNAGGQPAAPTMNPLDKKRAELASARISILPGS